MSGQPDLAPLPSAAEIVRYMRSAGWTHGRQGSHGAMWTRGDVEFSVPHEDHNPDWLREVVGRLASAEGRAPEETAAAIAEYRDARAAPKPCGCGPLQPCREHLGRGAEMAADGSAPDDSGRDSPGGPEKPQPRAGADVRERLGRLVHQERLDAGAERAEAEGRRRFLLEPWGERTEWQRELDIRIGEAAAAAERERAEYWHKRWTAACERADEDGVQVISQHVRISELEAKLAEVRAVLLEGGQGDATARCRAIAIVGTGENDHG